MCAKVATKVPYCIQILHCFHFQLLLRVDNRKSVELQKQGFLVVVAAGCCCCCCRCCCVFLLHLLTILTYSSSSSYSGLCSVFYGTTHLRDSRNLSTAEYEKCEPASLVAPPPPSPHSHDPTPDKKAISCILETNVYM